MTETQVHVEQSSQTTVQITTELSTDEITQTMETMKTAQHGKVDSREPSVHLTKDEIEEYEESQEKFRVLWENKREKVRFI